MTDRKTAIVTGASHGIGSAIARELSEKGYFVVLNYNGSKEAAEAVKSLIEADGGACMLYRCDVSDFTKCQIMIADILKECGHIDALINNAGITKDNLILRMSEQDFDDVIRVNLKGAFNCIKNVSRPMLKARSGRIVNIASVVGLGGNAGQANYAASKAGVIGLTKSVAKELSAKGITVNAVAPGFIETKMTEVLSEEVRDEIKKSIPMHTLGRPEDVAKAVAFLLSEDAGYITGQTLSIDGGMHM